MVSRRWLALQLADGSAFEGRWIGLMVADRSALSPRHQRKINHLGGGTPHALRQRIHALPP
jgi:hypothetical protein